MGTFLWRKLADPTLRDLGHRRPRQHAAPGRMGQEAHITSVVFFPKSITSFDHEQTLDKPDLKDILQNPRPGLFRVSWVMKKKEVQETVPNGEPTVT